MHYEADDGARQRKAAFSEKLAYAWTAPYCVSGPGEMPGGQRVGAKLLHLEVSKKDPSGGIKAQVSVHTCTKRRFNSHCTTGRGEIQFVTLGISSYTIYKYSIYICSCRPLSI